MNARETIFMCPEHGVGHDECCKEAENAGWMEYKGAEMAEDELDNELKFELGIRDEHGEPTWD